MTGVELVIQFGGFPTSPYPLVSTPAIFFYQKNQQENCHVE